MAWYLKGKVNPGLMQMGACSERANLECPAAAGSWQQTVRDTGWAAPACSWAMNLLMGAF